jgi:FkbM family methyltransferase
MGLLATLESVYQHPLNRRARFAALWRFGRWQISQRLFPRRVVTPWIGSTRLLVGAGETGLTGNIYCGLHEFADMAFVLHFLRSTDRFVDVGANAGSYTVLAAGAVGAMTIAIEPVPATFERLLDNVHVNRLTERVQCVNCGAGETAGELRFTAGGDTLNHALAPEESAKDSVTVPVRRLDEMIPTDRPIFIKLDVEGFEAAVVAGGRDLLRGRNVIALLAELNGSGARYGYDDDRLHAELQGFGLTPCVYSPFDRALHPLETRANGNVLYVRDVSMATDRVRAAARIPVNGQLI